MNYKLKKSLLLSLIIIFLANITGLILAIHIHLEGGAEHHDEGHCQFCQVLIDGIGKVMSIEADTYQVLRLVIVLAFIKFAKPLSFKYNLPIVPRAPPVR